MVEAAVASGSPAPSHALRATLPDCSPTWLTQPATTCSTTSGATPAPSSSPRYTSPSRSGAWYEDSVPRRLPTAERTAFTITTSVTAVSSWFFYAERAIHRAAGLHRASPWRGRQEPGLIDPSRVGPAGTYTQTLEP